MADDEILINKFVQWANGAPAKVWQRVGFVARIAGLILVVPALPLP
ncbi:hypothetical protein [Microbacterium sp. P5_E9]